MPLPQRRFAAVSLVVAYMATAYSRRSQESSLSSVSSFAAAFAAAYLVQTVAYAAWAVFVYPHWRSPLRHLPQPTEGNHFLLGQFPRIRRDPTGAPAAEWINSIPSNNGLIRYLGLFNSERLLVTSPRALAEVLVARSDEFAKPRVLRETLAPALGVGLLLAEEGAEHRGQRRRLAPAFAFRHVKELYGLFWAKGRAAAVAIGEAEAEAEAEAMGQPADEKKGEIKLEITGWASRTTLDIIGVAGLGRDFGAIQNPDNELAATYRVMLRTDRRARLHSLLGLVVPRWLLDLLPLRRNADIAAANAYIKGVCRETVIEKRKKQQLAESSSSSSSSGKDILSVALQSGGFSDDELVAQLMTFLAAGHETTSAALTWAVYLLSKHGDVQERLREEVRSHLPSLTSPTDSPTSTDIDRLPYLQAVCSEVLRFMAPVPLTLREARVDTQIQGQHVPKGTRIMLVPWAVNRSVALWGESATEFDPERWLSHSDGNGGASSNYAFMTFLHGPRSCIGMGFAKAEFACVLAAWVGRFAFRLQDLADADERHLDITGPVSSRPRRGLHVYARVVEGW